MSSAAQTVVHPAAQKVDPPVVGSRSDTVPPAGAQPPGPGGSAAPQLILNDRITVTRWDDPNLIGFGHDLRGEYVERFWLGVLGPATIMLLRRLARGFEVRPDGFRVEVTETALALGLGRGTGRNSMIGRTIDRACTFGVARVEGSTTLAVRSMLPPLTDRQLRRLPATVRKAHTDYVRDHPPLRR